MEIRRDLADAVTAAAQQPENLAACRVGDSPEHRLILPPWFGSNHLVTVTVRLQNVKAYVLSFRGKTVDPRLGLAGRGKRMHIFVPPCVT
jgi:hypothetical protein